MARDSRFTLLLLDNQNIFKFRNKDLIKGDFMRKNLFFLGFVFLLLISSCSQKTIKEPQPKEVTGGNIVKVSISGFKFVPADITIKSGDTVEWTNNDDAAHTIESADGTLKSDELSKGDTYSHTFDKAGKVDYICGIHHSMKGSITVQ